MLTVYSTWLSPLVNIPLHIRTALSNRADWERLKQNKVATQMKLKWQREKKTLEILGTLTLLVINEAMG